MDILDLIFKYVSLKKAGKNYLGLCPFHDDRKPSFSVSPSKQLWYCFGCGKGGDAITFIRELKGLTYGESLKELGMEKRPEVSERRQASFRDNEYQAEFERQYYRILSDAYHMCRRLVKRIETEEDFEIFGFAYQELSVIEREMDVFLWGTEKERSDLMCRGVN